MIRSLTKFILAALVAFSALPALAGQLNLNANAIPGFTGTTPFANASPPDFLLGTVDYAVFAPGDFTTAFPASGYTPTAGQLVYAYQIIPTDGLNTEFISFMSVNLNGDANNISAFELEPGNTPPDASTFTFGPTGMAGENAEWYFFGGGIPISGRSYGLVYSSPNVPQMLDGNVVDGGLTANVIPLPVPSPVAIPEPGTITMLWLGGLGILAIAARRRRV